MLIDTYLYNALLYIYIFLKVTSPLSVVNVMNDLNQMWWENFCAWFKCSSDPRPFLTCEITDNLSMSFVNMHGGVLMRINQRLGSVLIIRLHQTLSYPSFTWRELFRGLILLWSYRPRLVVSCGVVTTHWYIWDIEKTCADWPAATSVCFSGMFFLLLLLQVFLNGFSTNALK